MEYEEETVATEEQIVPATSLLGAPPGWTQPMPPITFDYKQKLAGLSTHSNRDMTRRSTPVTTLLPGHRSFHPLQMEPESLMTGNSTTTNGPQMLPWHKHIHAKERSLVTSNLLLAKGV